MDDLPTEILFMVFKNCDNNELKKLRSTNRRLANAVESYVESLDEELCDECKLPLSGPSCPEKEFILLCSGEEYPYDCPVRLHGTCCGFPEEAVLEDIDFDFSCARCRGLYVSTFTEDVYATFGFEIIPESDDGDTGSGSESTSSNSIKSEPMSDIADIGL